MAVWWVLNHDDRRTLMYAQDPAGHVAPALTRRTALDVLLRYNHFPPITGDDSIEFAEMAIAAVEDGDEDRRIAAGGYVGRAGDVFESWHLGEVMDFADDAEDAS